MPLLKLIVAIAENHAIGYQNKLLYYLPNDLKHFKALTTGHTIVMGRRTFESLPKGALPNRRNIVLSRQAGLTLPDAEVFPSLEDALAACQTDEQVFIIGGETVYREALPLANTLHLTQIHSTPAHADAFFPAFETDGWTETNREQHQADEKHAQPYDFIDYVRK